jgi:outer membrane protein assembly factor BamE (lipoprotein component of BamABCDE complex)|tara:strand:+ start:897 stop:1238 length:342 start_codon:yes stop_codon:yes gene_type:complete
MNRKLIQAGILLFLISCAPQSQADRMTLGTVQSSIHMGMTGGEVQEALGAPNIISKNNDGNEMWTYDRVSKEATSRGFIFWSSEESTQRTLTVLITFDGGGRVADYTYHSTEF